MIKGSNLDNSKIVNRSGKYEMKGFGPDLLWSGLRSGLPAIALAQARRAGCRATKSRRSQSESAKLSGAMGLPAVFFTRLLSGGLARGAPPASRIIIGLHFSPSSQLMSKLRKDSAL